jgi:hypothetical protein
MQGGGRRGRDAVVLVPPGNIRSGQAFSEDNGFIAVLWMIGRSAR